MTAARQLRGNAIFAQLPDREFDRIRRDAQIMQVEVGQQVYEPGTPITDAYFPISAVFSLVALADGQTRVEVATVGHEGMVGLPLFLGAASSPQAAFCQIAGDAARIGAEDLRRALADDGALHRALNRLTQATMVQIAQNVVCNGTHQLEQRAARWLLTTQDRVRHDEFPLTQEFLAQMLGARRPTVSQIARRLSDSGLISYVRGVMRVLDRAGLEAASCQCYRIVKAEFDTLTSAD